FNFKFKVRECLVGSGHDVGELHACLLNSMRGGAFGRGEGAPRSEARQGRLRGACRLLGGGFSTRSGGLGWGPLGLQRGDLLAQLMHKQLKLKYSLGSCVVHLPIVDMLVKLWQLLVLN